MTMRKNVSILFGFFLIAFAIPALPQAKPPTQEPPKGQAREINITGVWDMITQTPNGEMPGETTFTQEKEALKVTMTGPQGMPMAGEGTVKDDVVQWSVTVAGPNGSLTVSFTGTIDGEKMSGQAQAGEFGTMTWSATRKKS
jgi:hypothetical protein